MDKITTLDKKIGHPIIYNYNIVLETKPILPVCVFG